MKRIALALLAGVAAVGVASASQAADLMIDPAPVYMAPVASGGNWDGAYIGAFAGYGWGTLTELSDVFAPEGTDYDMSGWLLGATAGANFTISEALVAGIVGDIAWANIGGENDDFAPLEYNINWVGSLRGRLGFDGGSFLPYLTAGLAFANNTIDLDSGVDEDTQTHIGWTVGAGVEVAVADNVSLDFLCRYSDYGTKTYTLDGDDADFSLTSHAVTAGINFRF
jgi:outer membrane immunogenic protein